MSLPQVPRPVFKTNLPGITEDIIYSPFTIADRRTILMARETQDFSAFIQAVVDITKRNSNLVDLKAMKLHFIEKIFLDIFRATRGNILEATFTCQQPECKKETPINIPLEQARIDYGNLPDSLTHVVKLTDTIGVELEMPDWSVVSKFVEASGINVGDEFVLSCVKSVIADGAELTPADFTSEELKAWIDGLPDECAVKFAEFFTNIPILTMSMPIKCPHCGHDHLLVLRGLDDFFV